MSLPGASFKSFSLGAFVSVAKYGFLVKALVIRNSICANVSVYGIVLKPRLWKRAVYLPPIILY
jgi:hypothetical protein